MLLAVLTVAACAPGEGSPADPTDTAGSPTITTSSTPTARDTASSSRTTSHTTSAPLPDAASSTTTTQAGPGPGLTLAVVGDVMLGRTVGERIETDGPGAPLAAVREDLRGADLTIANLESPIGAEGTPVDKGFTFLAPPAAAQSLQDGGIDVVSLSNNHILDYGEAVMESTIELLDEAGIAHVGAGADEEEAYAPVFVEHDGVRLAFLAYMDVPDEVNGYSMSDWEAGPERPGVAWAHPDRIAAGVTEASSSADHVIVLLHTGYEGLEVQSDIQRTAARTALDSGATLVLGTHPHVLQGVQREQGRLIAWSLGNFVFDGFDDIPETDSAILQLTLDDDGVSDLRWTPVHLVDGFPEPLDPESAEGRAILDRLELLSD